LSKKLLQKPTGFFSKNTAAPNRTMIKSDFPSAQVDPAPQRPTLGVDSTKHYPCDAGVNDAIEAGTREPIIFDATGAIPQS
jgi:hypothetical protein